MAERGVQTGLERAAGAPGLPFRHLLLTPDPEGLQRDPPKACSVSPECTGMAQWLVSILHLVAAVSHFVPCSGQGSVSLWDKVGGAD